MVLMDPMISNFLASCIVKWLRRSVEDSTVENLEELTNYSGKLLNLAEHAPNAIAHNAKIPKLDRDLKSKYWNAVCSVMIEESNESNPSIKEADAEVIDTMLRRSDIARKVFVHYLVDRTQEGDVGSLRRCLPLIINTWPASEFEDERIIYKQTYLSAIKTMIDIVSKRNLYECVADPRWRQVVVEGFLLKAVVWDCKVHEQMVRFLAEYFVDPKILIKLGQQVAILVEWADIIVTHGRKDDKVCFSLILYLLCSTNTFSLAHGFSQGIVSLLIVKIK